MDNWTVKFLESCDNKDARGVYEKGSTLAIREDSARFWIDRGKAVRVADAPAPGKKSAGTKTVAQAEAETQKAASDLEAETAN